MPAGVEHTAGRVGHAGIAFDQHHMARMVHPQYRFPENRFEAAGRMRRKGILICRSDIAVSPTAGGSFDEPQFPDVPGDRGLGHFKAGLL